MYFEQPVKVSALETLPGPKQKQKAFSLIYSRGIKVGRINIASYLHNIHTAPKKGIIKIPPFTILPIDLKAANKAK